MIKNLIAIGVLMVLFCSCNNKGKINTVDTNQSKNQVYECELFSVSYPHDYYTKEDGSVEGNFHTLFIGKDSLDEDMTTIMWEMPNTFPSTVKDYIALFVSKEIEDYKDAHKFYDVMIIDSTYTISGYPTYSISSIFAEGEDSIIQSRTGLIIPGRCDMMIIQRANTKKPMDEVKVMSEIIQSIKIKE
jgi:hypothetical protein